MKRVTERLEQQGPPAGGYGGDRAGGGRGNKSRPPWHKDRDDSRKRTQDRDRSGGNRRRGRGRENSPLSDFRDRYPMHDRAFRDLEAAAPDVQRTVLDEFKPRREGEEDYSGLVIAFVKSVRLRIENQNPKNRDSDDEESQDRDR